MIDLLLLVMSVIWGTNYSIIKSAFRELDPQAFNAARMLIASTAFLIVIGTLQLRRVRATDSIASIFQTPARMTGRDWRELAALGFVGHFLYQYVFIGGLALTTVANSSLMLAATPVVIALMSAPLGQERVGARHWLGAALSMFGIYIVVGQNVRLSGEGLKGDVMMVAAVICWAIYTLGSRRLISRHSPVGVTGLSMAIGTLIYVPVNWKHLSAVDWLALSPRTWLSIVYSAIFALGVAYTIWYAAVRQIGSARTSVYSNVIPLVAMATAVVFLGEPLGWREIVGATAVLLGVALTRTAPQIRSEPCEP
ncbi:MAG TPA: DMT family transporter [Vicinamibacterales bacterium]